MSLDSRIREEFRRTADAAVTGVDPSALENIVARTRRVRSERRMAAGVLTVVVLVCGAWIGVTRIEGQGAVPVAPLSPPTPSATASAWRPVPAVGDQSVLDGRWETVATVKAMRAAGVSSSDVAVNAGTWIFTIVKGRLHAVHGQADNCMATTTIDGDQWSVVWDPGSGCDGDFTARFVRTGDKVRLNGTTSRSTSTATLMDSFFAGGMALVPPG